VDEFLAPSAHKIKWSIGHRRRGSRAEFRHPLREFGDDFVHVVGNEAITVDAGFALGLDQLDRRRAVDVDKTEIVTIAGRADSRRFSAKIL